MLEYTPEPLLVLRLRGSQAEMGAQHGAMLTELGGWQETRDFYASMPAALLAMGVPQPVRGAARRIFAATGDFNARRLHRARKRHFPEYLARTEAMLEAAGEPRRVARSFAAMDVLQNTVGTLGRYGLLHSTGLHVAAVPACTSVAVWGDASSDGQMRHARNFDFPGAGVWDKAPSVVFCDPDDGLRYGFVSTRGADTPGVTAFNEAGLSLTAHTRFHRDVRYDGVGVIDFGHELIRRCRTLADVRRVAAEFRTASTWGFLVSSASEQQALVLETTSAGVAFTEASRSAQHLATANRYQDPGLAVGEVTSSDTFVVDSNARFRRADSVVARNHGQVSGEDLQALLSDTADPDAPDPEAEDRLVGNCISNAMTVKSVVLEPQSGSVRMGIGPAPTGIGRWVDVPHSWDGPTGRVSAPADAAGSLAESSLTDEARRAAVFHYTTATRRHLGGESPQRVRDALERAVQAAPTEPNLRFIAAMFAVAGGELGVADTHLQAATAREHGVFRRAQQLLWHGRVLAANGRRDEARSRWRELQELPERDGLEPLRRSAKKESRRPMSRLRLRTVIPDIFLFDGTIPGA